MKQAHLLYQMVRADFLERVRRYSFLLTLGFALYLAYNTFRGNIVLVLGDYVGVENSAWFGAKMALVTTTFLTLVGFYVVRNSVQRDEQTRVGRILASTPMTSMFYVAAKSLSNLAVLGAMVGVLAVSAIIMQLLQGQGGLHLVPLLTPFVLVVLPAMAVTASVAVLFEIAPVLRGGAGNVIYFFVWSFALSSAATSKIPDLTGIRTFIASMGDAVRQVDPAWKGGFALSLGGVHEASKVFPWHGVQWTAADILGRMSYIVLSVGICSVAAFIFHRFDPAREHTKNSRKVSGVAESELTTNASAQWGVTHLTPLASRIRSSRFVDLVRSELQMILKGKRWWFYVGAIALIVSEILVPGANVTGVTMAALLFPVLLWSQLGSRESRYGSQAFIYSCPHPLSVQLPATWFAGVIVSLFFTFGYALHLTGQRDLPALAAWFACVVFIPSLALALGAWSGGSKAFEAIYTLWWYIGIANHVAGADYLGLLPATRAPALYLALSAVLLAAALVARRSKLAYA